MKKALFVIAILILTSTVSFASKEGILAFSSFNISSNGIGGSGPITVTGKQSNDSRIISLAIDAFGKKYEIDEKYLARCPKLSFNGIQLSYEAGYKELGGRTVYIQFQNGFKGSGTRGSFVLSLSEDGTVNIEKSK